jgi:hypothetical protein
MPGIRDRASPDAIVPRFLFCGEHSLDFGGIAIRFDAIG